MLKNFLYFISLGHLHDLFSWVHRTFWAKSWPKWGLKVGSPNFVSAIHHEHNLIQKVRYNTRDGKKCSLGHPNAQEFFIFHIPRSSSCPKGPPFRLLFKICVQNLSRNGPKFAAHLQYLAHNFCQGSSQEK